MPYEYDGGDDTDGDDGHEEDVVVLYEVPPVTAQEGAGPYEEQRPGMVPMTVKMTNFQKG